jgi:oxygen-independent coproporphyrinogen-3 oxidase
MPKNITTKAGIYIHIPFCERKCSYCDFYSITDRSPRPIFIDCLLKEIEISAADLSEEFDTIYFGGGTPSLLSIDDFESILAKIYSLYNVAQDCEITVEINPGTVNAADLTAYRSLKINRLSIGIQSFNDQELQFLGRIHNARQAENAIIFARNAGFDNISIDLISALPHQSLKSWKENLQKGLTFSPEHVSAYTLIIEENTPLYKKVAHGEFSPKSADEESRFFEETIHILETTGYLHYEISSFAENENTISRHNYKYWNHSNYLGFGPSAHSFWNGRRRKNISSLNQYIKMISNGSTAVVFSEELNRETIEFEYIFLSLRTYRGIDTEYFKTRFGFSFYHNYRSLIDDLVSNGFARIEGKYFKLTRKGMLISDEILPYFAKDEKNN